MGFEVVADAYDRFMGAYAVQLAPQLADLANVSAGQRALDVGCGPGALTAELVARLGPGAVAAVDPSESFVAAARERHPGVEVRVAAAEELPYPDTAFDATLAQLVVPFMADPAGGLAEMGRVTRPGGVVAACAWDHAGGQSPLSAFWAAVAELDPGASDESGQPGAGQGRLPALLAAAGLQAVEERTLAVRREHASFDAWWAVFELGVGPAGAYLAGLGDDARAALRECCRARLPDGPFTTTARAWAARATRPG